MGGFQTDDHDSGDHDNALEQCLMLEQLLQGDQDHKDHIKTQALSMDIYVNTEQLCDLRKI